MNERTSARRHGGRAPSTLRAAGWLTSALLAACATLGPSAGLAAAASVAPLPINTGNPTCDDFAGVAATWTEFKLQGTQLANGIHTDGTVTITIANFVPSESAVPGSFDWAATQGIDAVLVKAGSSRHQLYRYDPEAVGDTGLRPQAGKGNGISHLSFCYDPAGVPTESPSDEPTESPSDEPTQDPPPVLAAPTGEVSSTEAPNPSAGGVLAATGSPTLTPPPTDVLGGEAAPPSSPALRLMLLGLAALLAALLLAPRRAAVAIRR